LFSRNNSTVLGCVLLGVGLGFAPRVCGQIPVFDGQRAFDLLVEQCEIGPRSPGSPGNLELRESLKETAEQCGLKVVTHCFESEMSLGISPVELCNIIVSAGPESGPRLWLGAHFDTRPVSDKDPQSDLRDQPLTGANDGASGVSILWHLMEILGKFPPEQGVDLIFFDGEDSGDSGNPASYCIGSQRLASTLGEFDNPLDQKSCEGLIVLDMVGDRDLFIPQEAYSLLYAPDFTNRIFLRAQELGLEAFSMSRGPAVFDDHVPFLQQGVPSVDLIDFDFSLWHTTGDTPSACSAASLQQVGSLVTDLVYRR
jgi:Peptidase family M28